ncbi:hypothetical protein BT96DRAFT_1074306 [Gymnopus androsaceus JB14]|uniref:Uncharacterized protein n=1 Tax=Gymnopus androsaceus JB14 TaxID=1447944 RepID=A0A6A4I284_9AGAR|nr:hypothetical protein BT96DRAFT_1074306 [Gymnopus androsaceus JB14]
MSPEESQQIVFVGTVFFSNLGALIFSCGLFGVYILAFTIGIHIVLQKEKNGRAHQALIALLLAGFLMIVLYSCEGISVNMFLVKFGLVVSLPGGLPTQEMSASSKTIVVEILQEWGANFIVLMADAAIVWRAWALWVDNRLIKWTLLIILLLDISVTIADAIAGTQVLLNSSAEINTVTLDWLSVVLNLAVNIVATLLIAYRAWTHHQSMHALSRTKKTQVENILLLFVESGAIFALVQIFSIVIQALDIHAAVLSSTDITRSFINALYIYGAAINPVALVVLVQTGNTYDHSFHLNDFPSLEINPASITIQGAHDPST